MVLLTLATSGWAFLGYIAAAWFAPKKPIEHYTSPEDTKFWQGVRTNPRRSTAEVSSKFRDIDRRLADIELKYTSRNTRYEQRRLGKACCSTCRSQWSTLS